MRAEDIDPGCRPRIEAIVRELTDWPGPSLSSHRSARQFFQKLAFLADIGVTLGEPGMETVVEKVLASRDERGVPRLPMAVPVAFGGTGLETAAWMLCDAPVILRALSMFGVAEAELLDAVDSLETLPGVGRDGVEAWGCAGSPELGSWHGPGKKKDPCPYATLAMVRLLSRFGRRYEARLRSGTTTLLSLWEHSTSEHPYMFYMGTDFRKLKLPLLWYDILHVAEALAAACEAGIDRIADDPRTREIVASISGKKNPGGGFVPESVYLEFRNWDFGQKKTESAWMSHFIGRIVARLGR